MSDDLLGEIALPLPPDLDLLDRIIDRLEADRFTRDPLKAAISELRTLRAQSRPPTNGHRPTVVVHRAGQFAHVCAACGDEFTSNRRAQPGRHSWCGKPECKKQAAAQRAEEYRRRRAQA